MMGMILSLPFILGMHCHSQLKHSAPCNNISSALHNTSRKIGSMFYSYTKCLVSVRVEINRMTLGLLDSWFYTHFFSLV